MRNPILLLSLVVMIFGITPAADAATVTVPFFVQIDAITLGPVDPALMSEAEALESFMAVWPRGEVGDLLFGSVTYDNADVPSSGTYLMGMQNWPFGPYPPGFVDELGTWEAEWDGLEKVFGFFDADMPFPYLEFNNGKLIGLYMGYHADLSPGLEDEIFAGTMASAYGVALLFADTTCAGQPCVVDVPTDFRIDGTAHFLVPDASSTLLLTALSLSALLFVRRSLSH